MDPITRRSEQLLGHYAVLPNASLFDDDQRLALVGLQSVYRAAELVNDKPRADKAVALMNQYYPR